MSWINKLIWLVISHHWTGSGWPTMHCLKDGEKLFGFAMEFLWISLHFKQPSAMTMEAASLGTNGLTWFCILCFEIATQDAKSWFCEYHQSRNNFSEEKNSWTFWQIHVHLDKWVVEVDYRRITLLKTFGEGGEWWGILLFILLKKILDETAFINFSFWKLLYTIKPLNGVWD